MKAQRLDIISTLPQTIIETILCLIPIEEAVRTSILSTEWRYKWTTIPKLVFCESMVSKRTQEKQASDIASERCYMDPTCRLYYAIYQVLLLHQGPIQEFTLLEYSGHSCFEIDQIILHLSRNHTMLKKLTLSIDDVDLPLSLFSLHQLTDLSLSHCVIKHKPIFNGFGSLTSLTLDSVWMSTESLLHLLCVCPSLKSLTLLSHYDTLWGDTTPTIMEFLKCLPLIEHLTLCCCFIEEGVEVSVPASLIHLKYFCYKELCLFTKCTIWTFLSVLIKCSPNLEKIKLEMYEDLDNYEPESDSESEFNSIAIEECSHFWLEHLNELEIEDFKNSKTELDFVKVILVRSPNLKKVVLQTWIDDKNEELDMLKALLSAPRASPVEIVVENRCKDTRFIDDD